MGKIVALEYVTRGSAIENIHLLVHHVRRTRMTAGVGAIGFARNAWWGSPQLRITVDGVPTFLAMK